MPKQGSTTLDIPKQIPNYSDPHMKDVWSNQEELEQKRTQQSQRPIQDRFQAGEKVWILNHNQSKLQT